MSGWREVLAEAFNKAQREWARGERDSLSIGETVLALSEPLRLALARELLAGTGWVVAREVGAIPYEPNDSAEDCQHADGWNACRAAMLGEGE